MIKQFLLLFCLTFSLLNPLKAQDTTFNQFNNYHKWGITFQPLLYQKGVYTPTYGIDMNIKTKNQMSFNAGVVYHFKPQKRFSFHTGLQITYEPVAKTEVFIRSKDLQIIAPGDTLGIYLLDNTYSGIGLAVPVRMEMKTALSQKLFWNIGTGVRVMYFPQESIELWFTNPKDGPNGPRLATFEYFSQRNELQGSLQLTTGFYLVVKKTLWRLDFIYNKTFQNIFEGTYWFENMSAIPPSGGTYFLSGDYFGLSATLFIKRKE